MTTQERFATTVVPGPDQALALELVRVTEAAAIVAGRGGGRRNGGTAAAVAMHERLMSAPVRGTVVIGEGERTGAPVLSAGDAVGAGDGPVCDLGVSVGGGPAPATGEPIPLVAIAVAGGGALYAPPPAALVEQLAAGPDCADVVDITRPVAENLRAVAAVRRVRVPDLEVAVLGGARHPEAANEVREAGARVRALQGGGIAGAIAAARPESPVDLLLGTGGAAEGVIAAAALSCLGGSLQLRLCSDGVDEVLHTRDLVRGGRVLFCATGVTTGELLHGVRYHPGRATTWSVVLSSEPDTVRMVESEHRLARPPYCPNERLVDLPQG
ncbi:fructose-bisphosphatase class II [Pseudonocardia sp. C8]|nr:fructose-bisphosphatase class II [Pseudonocardia sp. C8]